MHTDILTMDISDIPLEVLEEIREQAVKDWCKRQGSISSAAKTRAARENSKFAGRRVLCAACKKKMELWVREDNSRLKIWICECGQSRKIGSGDYSESRAAWYEANKARIKEEKAKKLKQARIQSVTAAAQAEADKALGRKPKRGGK